MLNHDLLLCLGTQDTLADDGILLSNPACMPPALMRAVYYSKKLTVKTDETGIYKYSDWLPIRRTLKSDSEPVTYRSRGLGSALGLSNLYITFSGYWPGIGANMTTGTFKECEAYAVCARLPKDAGVLVLASAGNTARAFMKVASENSIPALIVVPEKNLDNLWSAEELHPCVKIVAAGGDSDYFDAIHLAGMISGMDGFVSEGGAKNVARRDGMGTTVLSAATAIGEIPDYYFQAVGSGTGAIAAYEASLRLAQSGDYAPKKMQLILSQNLPFAPMADAWDCRSRTLKPIDEIEASRQIDEIDAKVLSNRKPPYSVIGGLYDALCDSGGDIVGISNEELRKAQVMFKQLEGQDICPEAGVALASLISKAEGGSIDKDAIIMLNITGGGTEALKRNHSLIAAVPDLVINKEDFKNEYIKQQIESLYQEEIYERYI